MTDFFLGYLAGCIFTLILMKWKHGRYKWRHKWRSRWYIVVFLCFILAWIGQGNVFAGEKGIDTSLSNEQTILHCGLGEARDQGFSGLVAVFEAIRNRGHLKGVYGCKASFNEPEWVWDMAKKALEASATSNLVNGADHWHNVKREGETYWTIKMTKTVCIKDHCFYK